jgi:hypothetical protein
MEKKNEIFVHVTPIRTISIVMQQMLPKHFSRFINSMKDEKTQAKEAMEKAIMTVELKLKFQIIF